ncbi:MAG: hypothetical protein C4B59_04015 [Candidatus Methanogaster sp.]|uniref:Uncharacterized protein n=1 Tax=Candidatus Methanogaster sp. TaxID=3386292 RepID=A0AC61L4F0_9EURY|nr:MAG: hypothetical protein C4B59_04015 [ANME-2 cluster archaeon]
MNTTGAESEACFGAMPPEITEIQTHGLNGVSNYSGKVDEVVIWEDNFDTDPFDRRWQLRYGQWAMGWDEDSVYLPYAWWSIEESYLYTCAQEMYHSFSNNPFYGYYNPKLKYRFKSYSDDGDDAGIEVGFSYEHDGEWYGTWEFYHSPEEYSSWTTKSFDLGDFWTDLDCSDEYRVWIYEDADYSSHPHDGSCDPWPDINGHINTTYIKLIGTPNKPPYKPSYPSPAAYGAAGVNTTTDVSWACGDPNGDDTVKYNVYMGTSPSSLNLVCENVSDTTGYTGTLDAYKTYHWKVVALDEFGLTNEGDIWSFYMYGTRLTIDNPADGGTPVIHKDDKGDSYIFFSGIVIPEEDRCPGCPIKVYGPSDQFLGEWCTHQTLSAGELYAFSIRVYVHNATINLTGENTLTACWLRGDLREVSANVTVNLPSDYTKVVCCYVGNVPVCLSPEQIEMLKEMGAEAERQMKRDGIDDESLSTLRDVTTSTDLLLKLEEDPGAKISTRALKILTIFQVAHQTKETGGGRYDFIRRCTNELSTAVSPFLMPVMELCWDWDIAQTSRPGPLDTWGSVPAWGFMEAGVGATGEYLPVNYYKNWRIGPYDDIFGNPISGIMVKLDYVYMGHGDHFIIYKGDTHSIPEWESTPEFWHKKVNKPIPDTVGRIIVDCDDSGADSYGFKFDPECWIFLMCHHAEYYNYNGTGTHLVKLGTETTELNFSWGMSSPYPEVNMDNWMVVWSGQMYIPGNDTYAFYVASEKGTVGMKINRTDIFSNRIFSDPTEANSSTHLCKGWHNFAIWYHHTTGNASFALSWANSTMSKQVVPDKNMRTSRTELASLSLNAFFSHKLEFSTNASFTDLSLGDNITEWRWNFGDGTPDEIYNASTNPTYMYDQAGVYNATLTVVNGTGGMNTYSELVDVPIKGDANHDGRLSAADAVLILQMAACGINTDPAADVNSDGAITSLDALMVSQSLMKGVNDE